MTLKALRSFIRLHTNNTIDDTVLDALINVAKNQFFEDTGGIDDIAYATPTLPLIKLPESLIALKKVELDGDVLDRVYFDRVENVSTSYEDVDWYSVVLGGTVVQ